MTLSSIKLLSLSLNIKFKDFNEFKNNLNYLINESESNNKEIIILDILGNMSEKVNNSLSKEEIQQIISYFLELEIGAIDSKLLENYCFTIFYTKFFTKDTSKNEILNFIQQFFSYEPEEENDYNLYLEYNIKINILRLFTLLQEEDITEEDYNKLKFLLNNLNSENNKYVIGTQKIRERLSNIQII